MNRLADLQTLIVDVQATGSNPLTNHILEIGWSRVRARTWKVKGVGALHSHLVRLPDEAAIPARVQRVTGIVPDDLLQAQPADEVFERLLKAAQATSAGNPEGPCPTVIHFSRFESPYLQHLARLSRVGDPFPFHIICTHEISKRLFPQLPRRGLRAIAGYLDSPVPEPRRVEHHVKATAAIWCSLVDMLETDHSVRTLDDLSAWLAATPASCSCGRHYPMDRNLRLSLPQRPGVYRMTRSNSDVLYVGKAKSLKKRVNSYFQKRRPHAENLLEMLTQARGLDVTPTQSVLEAALLESDEIKRLSPPYNVLLRGEHRHLAFCKPDLQSWSERPREPCLGPVPRGRSLEAFLGLARALHSGRTPTDLSPHFQQVLDIGWGSFFERYAEYVDSYKPSRSLLRIGALLWRERVLEAPDRDSAQQEKSDTEGQESNREEPMSASRTLARLEETVVRGALWLRRARWLCRLTQASLAWECSQATRRRLLLVLDRGAIVERRRLDPGQEIPLPPQSSRSPEERRRHIDLATYDRLSTLTSELRRLLSQGRWLGLRLGARSSLDTVRLSNLLPWV